ncbi:hypothetical protein [Persicobacter sp. CCB-QB2]|uniref:hypothetical protein n=1 Tax=Persicobacter sp. CCB-QB2 TaxID=1561025 RepID=UPI0006A97F9B|nr:hypothetical protein [Persicobacter sp. CCB-QB2]
MSSHHIILDNQEPALLVLDFHACSSEQLGQILEWSPTVIIPEHLFPEAQMKGIKIDILLGEEHQEESTMQMEFWALEKEKPLLDTLLPKLIEKAYNGLWIVGAFQYCTFFDTIIKQSFQIYRVSDGFVWKLSQGKVKKWFNAGQEIKSPQATIYFENEIPPNATPHFTLPKAGVLVLDSEQLFWWAEKL